MALRTWHLTKGVGPLAGNTTLASLALFISWGILGYLWKDKDPNIKRLFWIGLAFGVLGAVMTSRSYSPPSDDDTRSTIRMGDLDRNRVLAFMITLIVLNRLTSVWLPVPQAPIVVLTNCGFGRRECCDAGGERPVRRASHLTD